VLKEERKKKEGGNKIITVEERKKGLKRETVEFHRKSGVFFCGSCDFGGFSSILGLPVIRMKR